MEATLELCIRREEVARRAGATLDVEGREKALSSTELSRNAWRRVEGMLVDFYEMKENHSNVKRTLRWKGGRDRTAVVWRLVCFLLNLHILQLERCGIAGTQWTRKTENVNQITMA